MALTEEQQFKVGFLQRCAEEGLSIEETKQRVKEALYVMREKKAFFPELASAAGVASIAAPIIAGAGTGYLAAKGFHSDNHDVVEEAKQDEVAGEYERLAEEARRRTRLRQLQSATGQRVIALTPGEKLT